VCSAVDARWLEGVPRIDPDMAAAGAVLEGCLVPAPAGRVRIAVGPVCLEFAAEDVRGARERPASPGPDALEAVLAELDLKPGATLLAVHDVAALQAQAAAGDLPFALAARPGRVIAPPSPRFAAAEARYLERHGLTADDPDPRAA
jgi:hypothetical protein